MSRGRPRLTPEQAAARDLRNAQDVELLRLASPLLGGRVGIARLIRRSPQWISGAACGRWHLSAGTREIIREELRRAAERRLQDLLARGTELLAATTAEISRTQDLLSRVGQPSTLA